jgi:hypothetical protein
MSTSQSPLQLDYARPSTHPRWSKAAIYALVLGIISGPVLWYLSLLLAFGIPMLRLHSGIGQVYVALATMAIGFSILLWFIIACLRRLARAYPPLRGRWLAIAGLVVACLWLLAIALIVTLVLTSNDIY